MTTSRQYTGERVDLDPLTASTITDNHLDAIRAELRHYRNRDEATNAATADGTPPATGQAATATGAPAEPSRQPC
ncbi:hypothetical protein [Streptomyces sp. H39-C1]|uniref:hypothetical protein n=1 Tax=Streptomyces sp. H39-C1 TaxID=3004355 RepID=UPI0022AE826B|nr:hypothetical protein [Streptomyces sp. H39-C1]MCZ4098269.1 hypothetical protein [Streptomyces sp. H39-C1]